MPLRENAATSKRSPWLPVLCVCGIVVAVFGIYYPALRGDWVWDDLLMFDEPSKPLFLDQAGLWRLWSEPGSFYHYNPLTYTTFWVDRQVWGEWTTPYHVENLLLHIVAALLLFRLLQRLNLPGAWLAAAVFAVHPVMVESVAFITERRNVLSMVFMLSALLAYGSFAQWWPEENRRRRSTAYAFALFLFLGAILSKVSAYAFPPIVLLVGWWRWGRLRWKKDILPTVPFFVLAVAFGLLAVWLEIHQIGARGKAFDMTLPERFLVAGRALWFYIGKFFWPSNISAVYPRWQLDVSSWAQWLFPITFALFAAGLWFTRKRIGRGPVTALLFFVGTLLPLLGFLNAYGMIYSFVADRWVYVPSLALCATAGVLAVRAGEALRRPALPYWIAAVTLPCLMAVTWIQAGAFAGPLELWQMVLRRNPQTWMAHLNLGTHLARKMRLDEALQEYEKAARLRPGDFDTERNMANLLMVKGRLGEAELHFKAALEAKPLEYSAHKDYAGLLKSLNRNGEAFVHTYCPFILEPQEKSWGRLMDVAKLLAVSADPSFRNGKLAVQMAEKANRLSREGNPQVLQVLAAAYAEAGQFDQAVAASQKALSMAGPGAFAETIKKQMALYEAKQPFHEATPILPNGVPQPSAAGAK